MSHLPPLRRAAPLAAVALLGLLWAPPAHADPKDDARRHFEAALTYAGAGNFQGALGEFLAAQDAWPHPNTLNNIARCYYELDDLEHALEYYRLYADAAPQERENVAPVIAVVEAQLRQRQGVGAAPPEAAPPPREPVVVAEARTAELDRLAAIAAELEAIRKSLATAPTASTAPAGTEPTGAGPTAAGPTTTAPSATDTALPGGSELLSDAYERVVVTASRYGQSPLDSPSTVTILTEDDIRASAATTIPDLLRRVAGVDVMELTAGNPDISIRGFNRELSNKVLVLIDGRSVYVDFLGNTLWASLPISMDEIERIEIIRGPGSAIYGANAMTGVINILTRRPGEGRTLARVSAGAPALLSGTVLADGRREATSWRLSAGWDQVGRWSADEDLATQTAVVPFLDDTTHATAVARGNARIDQGFLKDGLASVSAGWNQGTIEFVTLGALGDFGLESTNAYARGDLAYGPIHLRTFYNSLVGRTGPWVEYVGATSLDTAFDSDTVDTELEGLGDFQTGAVSHRVNAGAGYRYKRIAWDYLVGDGEPISEHHVNAFVQEEARMGPVALVASLRADRHPLVDLAKTISPRGAAIVRVAPKTSVRVTGGTAFRNPTFLETYLDLDQPTDADGVYVHDYGMYTRDPDGEMSPERILTGEVGLHDESTRIHTADLALYVNRVTDLIGLTDVEPEVSFFDEELGGFYAGTTGFTNLDPVYTAFGGEADVRLFPIDGLDVYGNLAVERVVQVVDGVSTVDESTSVAKVNLGAMYRTPWRVDLATHVSYVSPQVWSLREFDDAGRLIETPTPIDGRTMLNARVAVRPLSDDSLTLSANGWNLLQAGRDGFREHPNGQLVGARYWGELEWRF